ncbi:MAG: hypothetical protein JW934_08040 [Anaerolineae bacterium]|nr:hypothetical protein [Anaerolineae bacterium]
MVRLPDLGTALAELGDLDLALADVEDALRFAFELDGGTGVRKWTSVSGWVAATLLAASVEVVSRLGVASCVGSTVGRLEQASKCSLNTRRNSR